MNQQGAHRYEDQLLEFAYGELPAAEARSIEAHLKGCARCSGALREIDGVRRQMSQLAPEPEPDAGLESLLAYAKQAARRAQAGPAPDRGIRRWLYGLAGTASMAAVLLVVGVVANRARLELASMSPEVLRKDAVKEELRDREVTAAPAPPAAPAQAAAPGWAEGAGKQQEQQQDGTKIAAPSAEPVAGASGAEALAAEPRRNKEARLRDERRAAEEDKLSGGDYKLSTREDPLYRQAGPDMPDRGQNLVPGRGTRTTLPIARAPDAARLKSSPLPADGEMRFPTESKGGVTRRSKAPPREPLAGSGFGFEPGGASGSGGSSAPAQDEDDLQSSEPSSAPAEMERQVQLDTELKPEDGVAQSARRETSRGAKDDAFKEVATVTKKVARAPASPAGSASSKVDAPAKPAPPPPVAQVVAAAPVPAAQGKARASSPRELYATANRARAGSPEEIDALIAALRTGLSGQDSLDAFRRLCTHLESQDDERAYDYCSAWEKADPSSALASKRAREAEIRWSARKAKAKPAQAVDSLESSPASTTQKAEPAVKY